MTEVMKRPRSVDLEITSRCDARCRYCYCMNNEGVAYHDLPAQRWLDFLDECGRAKVMRVCIAGGEPFMRDDLFEIIDAVVRNHMRFQILTNGRKVTPEVAQRLKDTRRCDSVQVSLDGSAAEVHESMRGVGSFEPALRAIKTLHAAGLPTTVRVTVHAQNIEDLPNIARLLLEEIGLPSFSTNSISSLGTKAKYAGLFMTAAQRLRAMQVLATLDAQYPGRIQATAGPLAEFKMFHEMEFARLRGETIPGRGRLVGCGCFHERLAVRADGAYAPCVMLPQMILGYIGQDALLDVWRNSDALNALRQRIYLPLASFAECRGCEYLEMCTGNCAGTALSDLGDANRPSPEGCLRQFRDTLHTEGLSCHGTETTGYASTNAQGGFDMSRGMGYNAADGAKREEAGR